MLMRVHRVQSNSCRLFTKAFTTLALMLVFLMTGLGWSDNLKVGIEFTKGNYRIGPGDVLSINVYNQADMTQNDILVRDDGFASFNGVGELPVAGKTIYEVTQDLKERVGELVIDPIINLSLAEGRPGTVYVAGAIKHPGMVQLSTGSGQDGKTQTRTSLKLSNVIASAGGVNLDADLSDVRITQANSDEVIKVNLWNMIKDGASGEDVLLQTGDSVYIPARDNAALSDADMNLLLSSSIGPGTFPIRVIGEVTTPGMYELNSTSPYLNTAVAMAGGYKPGANKKIIAIRRFSGNNATTITLDPSKADTMLHPNDVVFISETGIYKAGRFMETVSKLFSPFTNLATTAFFLR
jgi:protein involved in polysaccharide export with SLBB domain